MSEESSNGTVSSTHRKQATSQRKMPPELLAHIFSFLVSEQRPYRVHHGSGTESTRPYPPLGWIRLGHVSREWRAALLNDASFWANEIGIYPRAMRKMLMRAGSTAPLRVQLPYSHGLPSEAGLLKLSQAYTDGGVAFGDRLRSLVIWNDVNPSGPQLQQAAALFDSPLTELRELELAFSHFSESSKGFLCINLDAPNLRKISLLNCCFTGAWLTPALTSINITMHQRPRSEWITSPDNILEVLNVCKSAIRSIRLINVFCDDRAAGHLLVANDAEYVNFPQLTDIYVTDFAAEAAALLSHLIYPPTAHTTVKVSKCRRRSDEVVEFRALVHAALGEHPERLNALRVHDDGIDSASPDDEFNIDVYELPVGSEDVHRCAWFDGLRPAVSFHIECDGSPYHIYPYLRDFFTEDIIVPVLRERVPHMQSLAFALGEVQGSYDDYEDAGPERHVGHIMDYAFSATAVVLEDPYASGCPVMDAICCPGRLPSVETLCLLPRSREGEGKVYCVGLERDLQKRTSKIATVHIDHPSNAPPIESRDD